MATLRLETAFGPVVVSTAKLGQEVQCPKCGGRTDQINSTVYDFSSCPPPEGTLIDCGLCLAREVFVVVPDGIKPR